MQSAQILRRVSALLACHVLLDASSSEVRAIDVAGVRLLLNDLRGFATSNVRARLSCGVLAQHNRGDGTYHRDIVQAIVDLFGIVVEFDAAFWRALATGYLDNENTH